MQRKDVHSSKGHGCTVLVIFFGGELRAKFLVVRPSLFSLGSSSSLSTLAADHSFSWMKDSFDTLRPFMEVRPSPHSSVPKPLRRPPIPASAAYPGGGRTWRRCGARRGARRARPTRRRARRATPARGGTAAPSPLRLVAARCGPLGPLPRIVALACAARLSAVIAVIAPYCAQRGAAEGATGAHVAYCGRPQPGAPGAGVLRLLQAL